MAHLLDRIVWNALGSTHAGLAEGNDLVRRYPPSIIPFAALRKPDAEAAEALADLVQPGETFFIVERDLPPVSDRLDVSASAELLQMLAPEGFERISDPRIQPLCPDDAEDMLALAQLTRPGPFTLRAQELGTFWGIRQDGQLIAMAGQRMRVPGFSELSGLCTHPDFQGRGLGKLMLRFVAGEISARGEGVFLHCYAANSGAIALYRALGFESRGAFQAVVAGRR